MNQESGDSRGLDPRLLQEVQDLGIGYFSFPPNI